MSGALGGRDTIDPVMDVIDGIDGFLAQRFLNTWNKPDTYGTAVFSVSSHLPGFTREGLATRG